MLNESQKKEIAANINAYMKRTGKSQNEIGKSLSGISGATISNMRNGKWNSITDELWRLISNYIHHEIPAETEVFKQISGLLIMCQEQRATKVFLHKAGKGKTFTCRYFANTNKGIYYVSCGQWSKKQFVENLLGVFGESSENLRISERVDKLKTLITNKKQPLLIVDEVDKLQNSALLFLVELYNYIYEYCGMFMTSTEAFEIRIVKNVRRQKPGFEELLSRFGGMFEKMDTETYDRNAEELDMSAVCITKGIIDKDDIENIIAQSKNVVNQYDMRILNERIRDYKLRNKLQLAL